MPIYEYLCNACGEKFSVLQSIRACDDKTECRNCGSKDTRKMISSFSCSGTDSGSSSCGHSHGGGGGG